MNTPEEFVVRLRPEILATPAYRQGKPAAADAFKLSSNENPFEPLAGVIDAVAQASRNFNRYPDASAAALRTALGERYGVSADEVIVGNGSVALLTQFVQAAASVGDEVVYSWRSFEAYPGIVTVAGATSVQVPNAADGSHDLDAILAAITDRTRVVIVCSPNNPTGTMVTAAAFAAFLAAVPASVLVLLDEAYAEFVTDETAVNGTTLLNQHQNLVILRTFSKAYGLAGLRVGWAIGDVRVLDAARSAAVPLSVIAPAQAAALASLEREEELLARVAEIVDRRTALRDGLRAQGWAVPDTQANFLWLPTAEHTVVAAEMFWDAGIVTRPFAGDGIRISIGEAESLAPILAAAAAVIAAFPALHAGAAA